MMDYQDELESKEKRRNNGGVKQPFPEKMMDLMSGQGERVSG